MREDVVVDSLVERYNAARDAQARTEAAALVTLPKDTVRAGALVILTDSSLLETTRRAAGDAWSAIDKTYGSAARVLTAERFVIRLDAPASDEAVVLPPWVSTPVKTARLIQVTNLVGNSTADVLRVANTRDSMLAIALRARATRLIVPSLDLALVAWLGGAPSALTTRAERDGELYTALVLSISPAAHECVGGSISACRTLLAVDDIPDVVGAWYGSAQAKRLLVSSLRARLRLGPDASRFDACVSGGADSVCDALLATVPRDAIAPPLDIIARHDLLFFALSRGGAESFPRLLATHGSLSTRLAAAAGTPADSLINEWRAHVIASAPPPVTLTPRTAWMALGWIVLLGLIATRSSRWR
ncbi:MAG: hypothetical protein M3081_12535 [Gemmatimonadota bacterium]|nr:hypothetical protein [Gemmatimonadota bacterium]